MPNMKCIHRHIQTIYQAEAHASSAAAGKGPYSGPMLPHSTNFGQHPRAKWCWARLYGFQRVLQGVEWVD